MKLLKSKKMTESELLKNKAELESINQQMEKLKERSTEIREKIVQAFFPADKEEGSKTVTEHGIKMELSKPMNYSISYADAELFFETHPAIAGECLGWSPRVKVSGFKAHQKELARFVTAKPGQVGVSFK